MTLADDSTPTAPNATKMPMLQSFVTNNYFATHQRPVHHFCVDAPLYSSKTPLPEQSKMTASPGPIFEYLSSDKQHQQQPAQQQQQQSFVSAAPPSAVPAPAPPQELNMRIPLYGMDDFVLPVPPRALSGDQRLLPGFYATSAQYANQMYRMLSTLDQTYLENVRTGRLRLGQLLASLNRFLRDWSEKRKALEQSLQGSLEHVRELLQLARIEHDALGVLLEIAHIASVANFYESHLAKNPVERTRWDAFCTETSRLETVLRVSHEKTCNTLSEANEVWVAQNLGFRKEYARLMTTVESVQHTMADLLRTRATWFAESVRKHAELEDQIRTHEERIAELVANEDLRAKYIEEIERALGEERARTEELEGDVRSLAASPELPFMSPIGADQAEDSIEQTCRGLETAREGILELTTQIDELKRALEFERKDHEVIAATLRLELQRDKDQHERQLAALTSELDAQRQRNDKAEAAVALLEAENDELKLRLQRVDKRRATYAEQATGLRRENAELRRQVPMRPKSAIKKVCTSTRVVRQPVRFGSE